MKKGKNKRGNGEKTTESGSRRLSAAEKNQITEALNAQSIRNKALLDEIVFILQQRLSESKIKVHEIESRVKEIDSVLDKCERKGIQDHNLLNDVVAARVVCLFRSDMSRVAEVIRDNFTVISV